MFMEIVSLQIFTAIFVVDQQCLILFLYFYKPDYHHDHWISTNMLTFSNCWMSGLYYYGLLHKIINVIFCHVSKNGFKGQLNNLFIMIVIVYELVVKMQKSTD